MPDAEKLELNFYPPSVNADYDYSASGIRWHCIANVNETIEIKFLVSRCPKRLELALASRRVALSGNYC